MKLIYRSLRAYYRLMQKKYPQVLWFGNQARREIALTFDDGPHPRDTPRVLEALARHGVPATFFLLGRALAGNVELVRQAQQCGHQLAIHGFRHGFFPLQSLEKLRAELEQTALTLAQLSGQAPAEQRDLRPPYGAFNRRTLNALLAWGYRVVMWDHIPPHWMQPLPWTIRQILDQARPGSVVVLHDGHGHGAHAAAIVEAVVPRLKDQGYQFITIDEMQRKRNP